MEFDTKYVTDIELKITVFVLLLEIIKLDRWKMALLTSINAFYRPTHAKYQ